MIALCSSMNPEQALDCFRFRNGAGVEISKKGHFWMETSLNESVEAPYKGGQERKD